MKITALAMYSPPVINRENLIVWMYCMSVVLFVGWSFDKSLDWWLDGRSDLLVTWWVGSLVG